MKIKRLEPGSKRTLLSATAANQLIDAINALLTMTGENGIDAKVSEGNALLRFTGQTSTSTTSGGGGGSGTGWTLYGDWVDAVFAEGVVVTYRDSAAIADGNVAGAYLSIDDIPLGTPAPGLPGSETFWKLLAPYHSDRIVYNAADKQIDINTDGTGSLPELLLEEVAGATPDTGSAGVLMRLSDLSGKTAMFREVTVCVAGVSKHMLILASEVYP